MIQARRDLLHSAKARDERSEHQIMSDEPENTDFAAPLDALFERWNRADQPGLVVGVRHHGRIVYRRAFGMASLETAVANSVSTRMRIGSTSKHFLAILALQLQEKWLLDLDASIGTYLPELRTPNAEPSLRDLLQHRGGTRCHIELGFIGHGIVAGPPGTAYQTLQAQHGRNFAPGEAMIYNNGGYHLVSLAVSRVTGAPLDALLKQYLFDPLEMTDTALVTSDHVMTPGIASFHLPADGHWRRGLFPSHEILGEGGIVSTVDDMLRWAACLQSRAIFGRERTLDPLLDIAPDVDGSPGYYGLGMMRRAYRGVPLFRHPGGVIGGSSDLTLLPDHGLDIIIMSNGAPGAVPFLLSDRVVDIVLADRLDPAPASVHPAVYRDHTGSYASSESGMVYGLEVIGDALYLRIARYAAAYALERDSGDWLTTGLTGVGTVRLCCERLDDGTPSLRIRFAGREEVFERLLDAEGGDSPPVSAEIEGVFASAESGLSAKIERRAEVLILHVTDRWGVSEFDLQPLGRSWLAIRSLPDADQFGATLWFPDGWTGGFRLNSARTRNLAFERVPVGVDR